HDAPGGDHHGHPAPAHREHRRRWRGPGESARPRPAAGCHGLQQGPIHAGNAGFANALPAGLARAQPSDRGLSAEAGWGAGSRAGSKPEALILTAKKIHASLVVADGINTLGVKVAAQHAAAAPARRRALWHNSAKGGDPMSHGPAERSAFRSAEHYR